MRPCGSRPCKSSAKPIRQDSRRCWNDSWKKTVPERSSKPDDKVRAAAETSISAIQKRLVISDYVGRLFTGLSLGSILLLVALGLAITYGLLGVINMAHGEMLMIGAYATYVTQQLFKSYAPGLFDWYLVAAVPVAFLAAGLVGMALERSVIRWLYGRPLETLLATWGISLFLIQLVRQIFGAQNVEVANPSWMSGGIALAEPRVALQPHRHHRIFHVRAAADVGDPQSHAAGPVRARRHAEPRNGILRGRAHRAHRPAGVRPGFGNCRTRRRRAFADRQCRPRHGAGLHHRFFHGCRDWAESASWPVPSTRRSAWVCCRNSSSRISEPF